MDAAEAKPSRTKPSGRPCCRNSRACGSSSACKWRLKGGRDERLLLIRDPCKVVQRAVLQSPQLSEREVESFANMATLSDETLRLIANNRKYRKNYTIQRALMFNPKTPLEVTLHLLPHLKPQDLKFLASNKNVSDTLRTAANRLQRQRTAERSS